MNQCTLQKFFQYLKKEPFFISKITELQSEKSSSQLFSIFFFKLFSTDNHTTFWG